MDQPPGRDGREAKDGKERTAFCHHLDATGPGRSIHERASGMRYARWVRALRGVPGRDVPRNLSTMEFSRCERSQGLSWSHAASSKEIFKTLTRE
jgi:hypothetical protein